MNIKISKYAFFLVQKNYLNKLFIIFILLIFSGCMMPSLNILSTNQKVWNISSEDFHRKIQSLSQSSSSAILEKTEFGFSIDGENYIDQDGKIEEVMFNQRTGFINYLVHKANEDYLIKILKVGSNIEPFITAKVNFTKDVWHVTTLSKESFSGKTLILGSKGFLLADNHNKVVFFDYTTGIHYINLPSEYQISKFQNGDVSDTNLILLRHLSIENIKNSNILLSLLTVVKTFLDIDTHYNYYLFNIDTQNLKFVNISSDGSFGRTCTKYSGRWNDRTCVQSKNHFSPISSSIEWMDSQVGTIVVTLENDSTQIYVTNIQTGKRDLLDTCKPTYSFQGFKINVDKLDVVYITTVRNNGITKVFFITTSSMDN